jgi:HlyD family type I secretion membrane fusion protein
VREGDAVEVGEVLLRLDETQSRASREMLQSRHDALSAEYARLTAEREGDTEVRFPPDLEARRDDARVEELLIGQERIFQKRRAAVLGRVSILEQTISQLESEVASYEAQVAATDRQLESIREQTANVEALVDRGFEARPRLLEFQRQVADLEGSRQSAAALSARANQKIGETRLEITQVESDLLNEVVSQQQEIRERLAETEESLRAATDVHVRREVLAPIAGTVVNLRFFTAGGVIRAGDAIVDIVPRGGELLVEARVRPNDIESVQVGLEASVRITAFRQRVVPPLVGRVEYVSADSLVDPNSGAAYYEAEIVIPASEIEALDGLALQPGMLAEVLIVTGERTLFRYAISPFTDSFFRALHEE